MINKKLLLICILFYCFSVVFTQTASQATTASASAKPDATSSDSVDGDRPQQYQKYQTVSWKEISKAKRYDVLLQKKVKDNWV